MLLLVCFVVWILSNYGGGAWFQSIWNSPWAAGVVAALLVLGFIKYQLDGFKPEVRARRRAKRQAEQDYYDDVTMENIRRGKH
jgi:hypothetical protein